ncbi:MAG: hypothetical protein GTO14_11285, partial [Anaerolineales bacterium]|nr:hypothetical protein [Anaerolineales bacterium]
MLLGWILRGGKRDPTLNAASSIQVNVGPGESTPVGTTLETAAFVIAFNSAFQAADVDVLMDLLHPTVIDLYGADACRAHLETVIETPTHIEIVEVIGVDTWDWVIDGLTTPIVNTHTVRINFTAEDQTTQNDVHIAQR